MSTLQRRLASLPPSDPSVAALREELSHCSSQLSIVRANSRYLALLSCAALLAVALLLLLLGWRLPIVVVHDVVNGERADRMARLGLSEEQLSSSANDFSAAFDWVRWLLKERPAVVHPAVD